MEPAYDAGYWEDYSQFIAEAERLTGRAPSNLIGGLEALISELDEADADAQETWEVEWLDQVYAREKIQQVLQSPSLATNRLLPPFRSEIERLDSRLAEHLEPSPGKHYWEMPRFRKRPA